jgi:heme/copper-type cytochrome/quinol oxidase subunit 4
MTITKKDIVLLLMAFSWPMTCISMLWANSFQEVHFFADPSIFDYLNWYTFNICNIVSYIFIFLAIWIYINSSLKKDKEVILIFGANLIVQLTDLIHYLLLRKTCKIITVIQAIIIIYASLKVLYNYKFKNK